jgi:tripartite-type tricarboxylate transporter receptor subunit TctC
MRDTQQCGRVFRIALAGVCLGLATGAMAQAFPSRPIKYVIPFPAGSATDVVFRPVVEHMSKTLGQNVLMDAHPGGGGAVASAFVKSQPPDGYTFYLASNTLVTNSLRANATADAKRDFSPICATTDSALVVAANADSGIDSLKDLIEKARANPGKLNYGSYGIGSGAHVFMELLKRQAKIFVVHIPYQGTAQATADAAAGRVEVSATILATARPFVASLGGSGKLKLIFVGSAERSALMPDVPGMKESGFPQIDFNLWGGFVGPAGLPKNVIDTLQRAAHAAYRDPQILELIRKFGQVANYGDAAAFARTINREYDETARLIKEAGLKLD